MWVAVYRVFGVLGCGPNETACKTCTLARMSFHAHASICAIVLLLRRPLHDTVLERYRVAAGSARPLSDYHLMHGFSIIHDYHLGGRRFR